MPRRPPFPAEPASAWDSALGAVACAFVGVFPFLPDERLNRLKLISIELGVLAMLALVGARALAQGGLLHDAPSSGPIKSRWSLLYAAPAAVGAWFLVNLALAAASPDRALAWPELSRVALAAGAFASLRLARLDESWTMRVLFTWTGAALLSAIYATLQQRGGIGPIMVPQMNRVAGTFGNPIFLSSYLVLSLFVATAARRMTQRESERALAFAAAVLIVPAIAASQTRSAYVGLAAAASAAVVFAAPTKKRRMLLCAAIVVVSAGALSYPYWNRDQAHLLIWRDTMRLVAAHPFFGVGLGAFHVHFPAVAQPDLIAKWPKGAFVVNHAHNEFLQALAEGGPLLFASFVAVFVVFFAGVWRRAGPVDQFGAAAPLALGVLAVAVMNLFSVDMRFSVSLAATFAVMGLAAAEGRLWPRPEPGAATSRARALLAAAWIAGMGWIAYREVIRPHLDQRRAVRAPGFFDERLLEPARTIGELEALRDKFPDQPDVAEKLAYAYAKEMKNADGSVNPEMTSKAVAAYDRVIALDPKRSSAHNNLANIYFTSGRADQAVVEWRRAAELDPAFVDPRLNLGKVAYLNGDLKEAAAEFQKVLKIQPGHPEATLYLRRMVE